MESKESKAFKREQQTTESLILPKELREFKKLPFPNAEQFPSSKNSILISVENVMDGVGDFMHLLSFAKDTREIASQHGFEIIGYLGLSIYGLQSCKGILNTISNQLKAHGFDKLYIKVKLENESELELQQAIDILSQHKPKGVFFQTSKVIHSEWNLDREKLCLHLAIDPSPDKLELPTPVKKIKIDEYSCSKSLASIERNKLDNASMGLSKITETHDCFGIKLHPYKKRTIPQKAERLCEFEDQRFVQLLLQNKQPTRELTEQYFSNNLLFPGYLQSYSSATIFIASHVQKYRDQSGILTKNCDFYLNAKYVDQTLILETLKRLGVSDVIFVTPQTTMEELHAKPHKVRIFCDFLLPDKDYKALYSLTEAGAGCSGDNSCSDAFSSDNIPFAMRYTFSAFLDTFWGLFPAFLNNFSGQYSQLKEYFSILCKFNTVPLDYNISYIKFAHATMNTISKVLIDKVPREKYQALIQEFINHHVSTSIAIGNALKDPGLQREWEAFRIMLYKDYNYTDNFEDFILKGALHLAANELKPIHDAENELDNPRDPPNLSF